MNFREVYRRLNRGEGDKVVWLVEVMRFLFIYCWDGER